MSHRSITACTRLVRTTSLRRSRPLLVAATAFGLAPLASLAAQFQPPTCYFAGAGIQPVALAFGRTGGTGNPDMVTASVGNGSRWFDHFAGGAQTSCPVFTAPTAAPTAAPGDLGSLGIAIGDVDPNTPGDEVVALEVAGFGATYQLQVYRGTTAIGPALPAPVTAIQLLVRDFNGDGAADAVVLDSVGKLRVYYSVAGALTAAVVVNLTPGVGPAVRMAVGSFNKDHLPDLVVVRGGGILPARAELWAGNYPSLTPPFLPFASQSFAAGITWPTPLSACVTAGDIDGDGCDDIVVGGSGGGGGTAGFWVSYVSRAAVMTALLPHGFYSPAHPVAMTLGDFDLDGDLDLAAAATDGQVHILNNDGFGVFANGIALTGVGVDIEACDLDGDGDLDLGICDGVTNGVTCVFCNTTDTGRCHHVLRAGVDDGYIDNDVQGMSVAELAYPRGAIVPLTTRWFDLSAPAANLPLAHTFGGLPSNIVAARLYVRLQEQAPFDNAANLDRLRLDFDGAGDWAFSTPVPRPDTVLCLDLANLPSSLNLLPRLQHVGQLDVMVQGFTAVDYMRLELTTRCLGHDPVLVYANGGPDSYYHDAWTSPGGVNWNIDASPGFASGLYFVGLSLDPAIGHAPFFSLCMTHVDAIVLGFLDSNGLASGSFAIGPNFKGFALTTQAVAFPPGPLAWPAAKWSHTISDRVY